MIHLFAICNIETGIGHEIFVNENIDLIKAYDYDKRKFEKMLSKLSDKIYISIDVDVFDCSFIRNTGTPEPGGFFWDQVIEILKVVFDKKKVIGADIVEFAPDKNDNFKAEAFSLAKLSYKLMALSLK